MEGKGGRGRVGVKIEEEGEGPHNANSWVRPWSPWLHESGYDLHRQQDCGLEKNGVYKYNKYKPMKPTKVYCDGETTTMKCL